MHDEEIIERCAIAVWNLWGKERTMLEDTERSRALSDAITAIRALKPSNQENKEG